MKRVIGLFFCSAIAMILSCTLFLASGQAQDDGKLNSASYWSSHNAPVFYGAEKITFEAGSLDKFDPEDPRFRVFARDFEDGDLTSKIVLLPQEETGRQTLDPFVAGDYQLVYQVTDSHNNTTSHTVQVVVTPASTASESTPELEPSDPNPNPDLEVTSESEPEESLEPEDHVSQITVERSVYTLPDMPNLAAAGISRQDNGDRQILGLALQPGESLEVCATSGSLDLALWTTAGLETTLVSACHTVEADTFTIPLVVTPILNDGRLDQLTHLRLTYSSSLFALNYYHAGDQSAPSDLENNAGAYGIVESETIMASVAAAQLSDTSTLENTLSYYQQAVESLDRLVGLDLNPLELSDQNVRTKIFTDGDFLDLDHADALHQLAQFYLSNFEHGDLVSRELALELFAHYAMAGANDPNRMILAEVEETYNAARRDGSLDTSAQVYALINLLDHFEGSETYAKFSRTARVQSNVVASADFFLTSLAESYGVNVLPYLEAWNQNTAWDFQISDSTKVKIMDKGYPLLSILADCVSAENLAIIKSDPKFPLAYDFVAGSVLASYNLTGALTLTVETPDYDKLAGKVALILDGKNTVRRIALDALSADNPTLEISDLPVGTYALQMPIFSDYDQPLTYLTIREQGNTAHQYTYTEVITEPSDELDDEAYMALRAEILAKLRDYAQRVTEQELNNRNRNAAEKSALVRDFQRLRAEDQTSYAGLIARIERGGLPAITYVGAEAYASSSKINFYELITATDPEDGVMELNSENTKYRLERIDADHLTYYIIYQVTDSDRNTVTFQTAPIFIADVDTDDENNELPDLPDAPELPTYPDEAPDNSGNNSSDWIGGGANSTPDPGEPSRPGETPSRPTTPGDSSDASDSTDTPSNAPSGSISSGTNDVADAGIGTGVNTDTSNDSSTPSGNRTPTGGNFAGQLGSTDSISPLPSDSDDLDDSSIGDDRDLIAGSATTTKPSSGAPTPATGSSEEQDFFAQVSAFFTNLFEKITNNPMLLASALVALVAVVLLFVAAKKYIELRADISYQPENEISFEDPIF